MWPQSTSFSSFSDVFTMSGQFTEKKMYRRRSAAMRSGVSRNASLVRTTENSTSSSSSDPILTWNPIPPRGSSHCALRTEVRTPVITLSTVNLLRPLPFPQISTTLSNPAPPANPFPPSTCTPLCQLAILRKPVRFTPRLLSLVECSVDRFQFSLDKCYVTGYTQSRENSELRSQGPEGALRR